MLSQQRFTYIILKETTATVTATVTTATKQHDDCDENDDEEEEENINKQTHERSKKIIIAYNAYGY